MTLSTQRQALRAQIAHIGEPSTPEKKAAVRACRRKLYDLRDEQDMERMRTLAAQELRDFATTPALFSAVEARDSAVVLLVGQCPLDLTEPLPKAEAGDTDVQKRRIADQRAQIEDCRTKFKRVRNVLQLITEVDPATVPEETRDAFIAFQRFCHERREQKLGQKALSGSPSLAKEASVAAAEAGLEAGELSLEDLRDCLDDIA
jgi:hypothetical protein